MSERVRKAGWVMVAVVVTACVFFGLSLPALAGWVIEEVDADFPASPRIYYFQDGKVRVEGLVGSAVFLVDFNAEEGFLVDGEAGKYAGGRIEQVEADFRTFGTKAAARAERKRKRGDEEVERPPLVMPPVKIEKTAGEDEVAGFKTEHFRVLLDEKLVEELWVATALAFPSAAGKAPLQDVLEVLTGRAAEDVREEFPPPYEVQPSYQDMLRKGYPVRRIRYYIGEKNVTEVRRAVERDLPPSTFAVPPNLEKSDYIPLFFGREE